jgi:glycosyltransferase involved in cell wall biosynthesis
VKKIEILYDASLLQYGLEHGRSRTGIFFVAYNILLELSKREGIRVSLYVKNKYFETYKFIKKDKNLSNIKIINDGDIIILSYLLFIKNHLVKIRRTFVLRMPRLAINVVKAPLSLLIKILRLFNFKKYISNLGSYKYDVFFSPCYEIPKGIKKNKRIKKCIVIYDMIPFLFPKNYPEMKTGKYWIQKLMKSLNKDHYLFTISDNTKNDLIKLNKNIDIKKVNTIHLAASDDFYQCKDKNIISLILKKYNIPEKYILSLCTIEPRKNLPFAIKGFIEFIRKNDINDLYFVLVGSYWEEFVDEMEKTIDKFDCYKDKIIRTGYVSDGDLSPLYSGAEFFVYPSLYEGFGLPPLEAMKCGTPVITSNTSSLPEVVGDVGIMVNPKNINEIIDAYDKLYFDKDLRKQLSKNGLKRAKQFTWEKTVDKILNNII